MALTLPAVVVAALALAQPAIASTPATDSLSTGVSSSAANDLSTQIAQVARTQVGVGDSPVATSFSEPNCNPYTTLVAGFSANSNGCGHDSGFNVRNSNENWCADFVKWVWQQAGVTQDMNTINAAASSFYKWALNDGQSPQADSGTPRVGDALVFFGAGAISPNRYADHVGIVVSVNSDGTIDMVNGDFLGSKNIAVQLDSNLTLSTFAPHTWGAGEQWVIVSPPTRQQQPAPTAHIEAGVGVADSGTADTAVVGTEAHFTASATQQGGSITGYYWTFGDGRTTNATGADVTHVFSTPGEHTITVTATSNLGTITTQHTNVTVLGASAAVAAVPSTTTWYSSYPVSYYRFVRASGALAADVWDGASWLEVPAAGQPSDTGSIASLAYPDERTNSATTPHAYFRSQNGSLAQTYLDGSTWKSENLPGTPAAGSDIVAAATATGPAVFFVDDGGHLNETTFQSGDWSTHTLTHFPLRSQRLALATTTSGPTVFGIGPAGVLTATSQQANSWATQPLGGFVNAKASVTAVTTPTGQLSVIATAASARGPRGNQALVFTETASGQWTPTPLPNTPASGSAIAATNYLLPSAVSGSLGAFVQPPGTLENSTPAHPLGTVVAYLGSAGSPAVAFDSGSGWQTSSLPGATTGVDGLSAFPVAHQPIQVYLETSSGPTFDTTGDTSSPSGPWSSGPLPSAVANNADRVLLYAASDADAVAAKAAADAAGLPLSQVTHSLSTAWAGTLSGNRLVIAVGQAATNALEYNVCGWPNPSAVDPGSTPFDYVTAPRTTPPPAGLFLNSAAADSSQVQQRAVDLAYFAVHGSLPPGQSTVPAAARATYTCLGSSSPKES